jgi:hydrogenase maturation protein HypF
MMTRSFKGSVIAYGGELKNTFCVAVNSLMYPSSYIGDLTDLKGKNALKESAERMLTLLETKPTHAVCDLHPSYNSSAAAEESGLKLIRVQHHYAHILSCMAENDHTDEVIGISLDGTGYGTDGTIWGGEILKCSLDGFERKGHIRPFLHTGGDIASREGYRIAISMLIDIFSDEAEDKCNELGLIRQGAFRTYKTMHDKKINTAVSTSCGRLFDAASAILGIRYEQSFEGEAATALEFKAMEYEGDKVFECMDLTDGDVIATDRIIRYLAEEKLKGIDTRKLAYAFHYMLAKGVARMAVAKSDGIKTAALSGGCYQNKLLTRLTEKELKENGFNVLLHSMVPPNDGGIALGQALYGMHKINNQEDI